MATENDDLYLDLSYMDENDPAVQNGADTSQYDAQDDSADLYADETYDDSTAADKGAQASEPNASAQSNANETDVAQGDTADATQDDNAHTLANQEQNGGHDIGASRKRKDRDEDEYSQTLSQGQSQTPRPASTTPMPPQPYGQIPLNGLNVQQLLHTMDEEIIREWATAVGRENDIEELKFDEFKPNGKSKRYAGSPFVAPHRGSALVSMNVALELD
jgi:hypothetical protein